MSMICVAEELFSEELVTFLSKFYSTKSVSATESEIPAIWFINNDSLNYEIDPLKQSL